MQKHPGHRFTSEVFQFRSSGLLLPFIFTPNEKSLREHFYSPKIPPKNRPDMTKRPKKVAKSIFRIVSRQNFENLDEIVRMSWFITVTTVITVIMITGVLEIFGVIKFKRFGVKKRTFPVGKANLSGKFRGNVPRFPTSNERQPFGRFEWPPRGCPVPLPDAYVSSSSSALPSNRVHSRRIRPKASSP